MKRSFGLHCICSIGLSLLLCSSACSRAPETSKSEPQALAGALDPQSEDLSSTEAQLRRALGQTRFLNLSTTQLPWEIAAESKAPAAEIASDARAIQEADLFKLGRPGSKLLYLLNPYRGLQVVDFQKGAAAPQLIGRTAASGREPIEMYFIDSQLQIIAVERAWTSSGAHSYLVVYSVADPKRPQVLQMIEVEGEIADSRFVGEVLYVASTRAGDLSQQPGLSNIAQVTAYALAGEGLREVDRYDIDLPVQSVDSLNIIETQEGERRHYYLIASLGESRFSWFNRQSTIEVVDISDPKGAIRPLLVVTARGLLKERSATTIKDGTLIAVSNFWQKTVDGRDIRAVAVESFILPTATVPTIDAKEAEFRRVWFERELSRQPADADGEALAHKLSGDPTFGLRGVFVQRDGAPLSKELPDQVVTVGDASGLHADLQDVRFVGDRLYVFWVPANQIDPLDVFDIQTPATRLTYLGRTLFEGWIERAIPVEFAGRTYILGLGWIVAEPGAARTPQVALFSAESADLTTAPQGEKAARALAQLTLAGSQWGAAFNDRDSSIEVKLQGDGTGTIIFPAWSWGQQARSGGKLIGFDLRADRASAMLREGGFLAADAAWLRRVFSNPELDKLHALTDRSLSTFDLPSDAVGLADQVVDAVSVLELARDIVAFAKIEREGKRYGLQIVALPASDARDERTSLRLVPLARADAETSQRQLTLPGRYETHLQTADGSFLVLTRRYNVDAAGLWTQSFELHRVRWGAAEFTEVDHISWPESGGNTRQKLTAIYRPFAPTRLEEIPGGRVIVSDGQELQLIQTTGSLRRGDLSQAFSCLPAEREELTLHHLHEKLYVSYAVPESAKQPEFAHLRLVRRYFAPVAMATLQLNCAEARNIPGRPLRLEADGLVTEEERFLGLTQGQGPIGPILYTAERAPVDSWPETASVYIALHLDREGASLQDLYSRQNQLGEALLDSGGLLLLERTDSWSSPYLVQLMASGGGRFARRAFVLPAFTGDDLHLVTSWQEDDSILLLMQNAQRASVWQLKGEQLERRGVRTVGLYNELSSPQSDFAIFSWWDAQSEGRMDYDSPSRRLSLASGLWGVQQILIGPPLEVK